MEPREKDVQKLLEAMDEELRINDYPVNCPFFNFDDSENEIIKNLGFSHEYVRELIKRCQDDGYIKFMTFGHGGYRDIALTDKGRDKAIHEKRDIKSRLCRMIKHPLFLQIICGIVIAITSAFIGRIFSCTSN